MKQQEIGDNLKQRASPARISGSTSSLGGDAAKDHDDGSKIASQTEVRDHDGEARSLNTERLKAELEALTPAIRQAMNADDDLKHDLVIATNAFNRFVAGGKYDLAELVLERMGRLVATATTPESGVAS